MRIAIIADPVDEQYAGIHTYTKQLIQSLLEIDQKNEYVFIHLRKNDFFRGKGHEVIIPLWRWLPLYTSFRKFILIPFVLWRKNVDVIHEPAHIPPFLFWPTRAKKIVTIHDLTPVLHPEWHPWPSALIHKLLLPLILRKADRVLTVSESTKSDIEKLYHPKCPVMVTYLAARKLSISRPVGADDHPRLRGATILRTPFLLHVGTLEPRKNLVFLIRVFEILKTKYNLPHHLYLVGKKGWKCEDVLRAFRDSSHKDMIHWVQFVPEDELAAYYKAADLFVFPSHYEGFGLPLPEAMQVGCPVIAGNHSSLGEVVGKGGVFTDTASLSAFAQAIHDVVRSPERLQQLKKAALEQSKRFSFKQCAQETLKVYLS